MKTTILGGGNIGTLMAAEFANKGHDVTVYTSKPEKWSNEIEVYDASDRLLKSGVIKKRPTLLKKRLTARNISGSLCRHSFFRRLQKNDAVF